MIWTTKVAALPVNVIRKTFCSKTYIPVVTINNGIPIFREARLIVINFVLFTIIAVGYTAALFVKCFHRMLNYIPRAKTQY